MQERTIRVPTAVLCVAAGITAVAFAGSSTSTLSAKVWFTPTPSASFTYPETAHPSLEGKSDAGVVFSGGGVFLEPQGIPRDAFFSQDTTTVGEIKAANPTLRDKAFVLPAAGRPYMVVGTSMVGPSKVVTSSKQLSWTGFEGTPLYFGTPTIVSRTYITQPSWYCWWCKDGSTTLKSGGYIESWAAGNSLVPLTAPAVSGELVPTTAAAAPMTLAELTGMSSTVVSGMVETEGLPKCIGQAFPPNLMDWPRNAGPGTQQNDMVYGDGGLTEFAPLIPILRRKVSKIVAFFIEDVPMATASQWNPKTQPYQVSYMGNAIPAYFGHAEPGTSSQDFTKNQVFDSASFGGVVAALQAALASGKGAVATTPLTTVENQWWGVQGGVSVNITWVYLTRVSGWEAELGDQAVKKAVQPSSHPEDPTKLATSGPFKNFPYFGDVDITSSQANLLADMAGWVIGANRDLFQEALA